MKTRIKTFLGLGLLITMSTQPPLGAQSLKKLEIDTSQNYVQLEFLIREEIDKLGEIKANRKNSRFMSNADTIYLDLGNRPTSIGDRFSVIRVLDNMSLQKNGKKIRAQHLQILGEIKVTNVRADMVEATVMNAQTDMVVGDWIVPTMPRRVVLQPQEPSQNMEGRILKAAASTDLVGPYHFAFVDLGAQDGLRPNDQFVVYKKSYSNIGSVDRISLPDVEVARVVAIDVGDSVSTVYTLASSQDYDEKSLIRSDISQVRYLEESDVDLSVGSNIERPTQ